LPLFHERLETMFDYLPGAPVVFDHLAAEAIGERHALIADHYEARQRQSSGGAGEAVPYKPVPPQFMYLSPEEVKRRAEEALSISLSAFDLPDTSRTLFHAGSKSGRSFAEERANPDANVFDIAVEHLGRLRGEG